MLKLISYRSIHDIESQLWNSLIPSGEIYHKHEFVCLIEDSKEDQTKHWYILVYMDDLLVATACISKFRISLGCLMQGENYWIKTVRRYYKNFMTVDVLMCGLPISLGQKNIVLRKGTDPAPILELAADYMKKIAEDNTIDYLFFKEISESELNEFEKLSDHGFVKAHSLPYMEMDVKWNSFYEYLNSLRHPYRRKIKKGLNKFNIDENDFSFNKDSTRVYLNSFSASSAKEFYQSYLAIMDRAATKLEILSYDFFELLFQRFQHKMEYLQLRSNHQILASGILFKEGDGLFFMLCALPEYKNKDFDPYFNLLYAIVNLAIKKKCKKISLGQTAYWSKQQIGGYPKEMFIYYHCRRRIIHYCLNTIKNYMFPELKLKKIDVFKHCDTVKEKIYVKMN